MTQRDKPNGIGFYAQGSGNRIACGDSAVDLRLSFANDHLPHSRLRDIRGYYTDEFPGGETYAPIVARLQHGRFLSGYTMGSGMTSTLLTDTTYTDIEDAARNAHYSAESAAEREREYQAEERKRLAEEERKAESAFRVIVGNIGTVVETPDEQEAQSVYDTYVALARTGNGRSEFPVTMLADGELYQEETE
jgi:hypothetical protein